MFFPGKIAAQGAALAPIAVATRPQGAPLTVILTGKTMRGSVGRASRTRAGWATAVPEGAWVAFDPDNLRADLVGH